MLQVKLNQNALYSVHNRSFPVTRFSLQYSQVTRWLALVAIGFAAISFGLQCYHFLIDPSFEPMKKFNIDGENTYSAYFSMLILLASSVLLFFIAWTYKQQGLKFQKHWFLLALLFLYLSMDESIEIHEKFIPIVQQLFNRSDGVFIFAWVIPFGVLVVLLGLGYIRFLLHLPKKTVWRMVAAAAIYVGGALGMEVVGTVVLETLGDGLGYQLCMTIEETMEMLGIVYFMYTLLDYISHKCNHVELHLYNPSQR